MRIRRFNENINIGEPKIGDYAICSNNDTYVKNSIYDIYILNNIGKICTIMNNDGLYLVKYEDFPGWKGLTSSIESRWLPVEYWSENKSDLELILKTRKFNI